jgi:hypothetical protein
MKRCTRESTSKIAAVRGDDLDSVLAVIVGGQEIYRTNGKAASYALAARSLLTRKREESMR